MTAVIAAVRHALKLDPPPDTETEHLIDEACETIDRTNRSREQLVQTVSGTAWETLFGDEE